MRPRLRPRDIVRVELRLPQRAAEVLYWCAQDWNVSLSTAGAKLIELGYEHAVRREAVSEITAAPTDHRDSAVKKPATAGGASSHD